ncbi:acetylornithine deacetylase [Haladaptatus litoreus]|uniref:Acetylornithine deacetylase n=1 Tax=Haladaptatus litoreus TaxID=553468 RepID=A0A1N6VPQ3_9EURY|nr:M20 family metallopeptidase [Haladaptatus litoreus]SIQ79810.1 acetylornithine deacetylase [Haladaptatus litoreus]
MSEFDPIAFLERAVQTPSHESVGEMRDLLVKTLESAGVAASVDDAGNVLAEQGGENGGPHVVLNTHIDTVPPHVPFSRDGDRILGRGSCDAKGPLAAFLAAFLAVEPDRGKLTLAITPDEETDSAGAAALSIDADAVIVGEPTGLDVCNAGRGRFQGTVTLHGENAHAAHPEAGVNAIAGLSPVLAALSTFDTRDPHPELGLPTLTPTTIEGGTATNQIPAESSFVIDRRSVPPEGADEFRALLETHLRNSAPEGIEVDVSLAERDTPFLEAFSTPADSDLVETLRKASGGEVRPFGAATEASYFAQIAPTVVFGPGVLSDGEGAVAHGPREYVNENEVTAAEDAVTETLRRFLD